MSDQNNPFNVVAEILDYFDSFDLATWAPIASIIERERRFGMEQAAKIAGSYPKFGPRDDFNRGKQCGRDQAAADIRKRIEDRIGG